MPLIALLDDTVIWPYEHNGSYFYHRLQDTSHTMEQELLPLDDGVPAELDPSLCKVINGRDYPNSVAHSASLSLAFLISQIQPQQPQPIPTATTGFQFLPFSSLLSFTTPPDNLFFFKKPEEIIKPPEVTLKRRRNSGSRTENVTIAAGFRFGITTWNMHGFQKSAKVTVTDSVDYEGPLAKVDEHLATYRRLYKALYAKVADMSDQVTSADQRYALHQEMVYMWKTLQEKLQDDQIQAPPPLDTPLWTLKAKEWGDKARLSVALLSDGNVLATQKQIRAPLEKLVKQLNQVKKGWAPSDTVDAAAKKNLDAIGSPVTFKTERWGLENLRRCAIMKAHLDAFENCNVMKKGDVAELRKELARLEELLEAGRTDRELMEQRLQAVVKKLESTVSPKEQWIYNLESLEQRTPKRLLDYVRLLQSYHNDLKPSVNNGPAKDASEEKMEQETKIETLEEAQSTFEKIRQAKVDIKDNLDLAKGALLRRTSAAMMAKLLKLHRWLDAMVLQEVKYSGIDILEHLAAENGFEVWRGPMMKGGGEVEYFPLLLRKDRKSYNNNEQTLEVKRIWWINTDGTVAEMADKTEKRAATDKPHASWAKSEGRYRPVVVYDIEIGTGSKKIVHVGVIHTTPSEEALKDEEGKRVGALSESQQDSIRSLRPIKEKRQKTEGTVRKGQLKSQEFQRLNQFSQLQAALDRIATEGYGDQEVVKPNADWFLGPWILAGDYYLFRESRTADLETEFDGEKEEFHEPFNKTLEKEFRNRLKSYRRAAGSADKYTGRREYWELRLKHIETLDRIPQDMRKQLLQELVSDNVLLASEYTSEEASIRAKIRRHKATWLHDSQHMQSLSEGKPGLKKYEIVTPDAQVFNLCMDRWALYAALENHCDECAICLTELEDATTPREVYHALRSQNERLMNKSLTASAARKPGKTIQNIPFLAKDDPLRNTVGITFRKQLDDRLEVTQAVSGSNLNKFMELSVLRLDGANTAEEFSRYATRIKVADFFINTWFDRDKKHGTTHWTANCVGILRPDVGCMTLADAEDLQVSKYWAAISDHFPIGAYYSTDASADEAHVLRYLSVLPVQNMSSEDSTEQMALLERERRMTKLDELRKLALLKMSSPSFGMKTTPDPRDVLPNLIEMDPAFMADREVDDLIWNLEEWLDVHDDDQFEGLELDWADFEGVLQ